MAGFMQGRVLLPRLITCIMSNNLSNFLFNIYKMLTFLMVLHPTQSSRWGTTPCQSSMVSLYCVFSQGRIQQNTFTAVKECIDCLLASFYTIMSTHSAIKMAQYYSTENICYLIVCHGIDCAVCPLDVTT